MQKNALQLSENERKALRIISSWFLRYGRGPSVRELTEAMDFGSTRSAFLVLRRLIAKKYLSRKEDGSLRLMQSPKEQIFSAKTVDVPLVGNVSCGVPVFAKENIEAYYPVSQTLARPGGRYFLLRAQGDSMNKADISDG